MALTDSLLNLPVPQIKETISHLNCASSRTLKTVLQTLYIRNLGLLNPL